MSWHNMVTIGEWHIKFPTSHACIDAPDWTGPGLTGHLLNKTIGGSSSQMSAMCTWVIAMDVFMWHRGLMRNLMRDALSQPSSSQLYYWGEKRAIGCAWVSRRLRGRNELQALPITGIMPSLIGFLQTVRSREEACQVSARWCLMPQKQINIEVVHWPSYPTLPTPSLFAWFKSYWTPLAWAENYHTSFTTSPYHFWHFEICSSCGLGGDTHWKNQSPDWKDGETRQGCSRSTWRAYSILILYILKYYSILPISIST